VVDFSIASSHWNLTVMQFRLFGLSVSRRVLVSGLAASLVACGGGGGGGTATTPPLPTTATVSGRITFDRVPFQSANNAYSLNFAAVTQAPARAVVVELLPGGGGTALATTLTDTQGNYTFTATPGTSVLLRVRAKMMEVGSNPGYTVTVVDNTSGNAPYIFDGSAFTAAAGTTTRSVNFASGWNAATTQYVDADRAAAPFAILDTLYKAIQLVRSADAAAHFPDLKLHWSVRNKPVDTPFNVASGNVGSTFFTPFDSGAGADFTEQGIYVLGDASSDTDEYDEGVIAHEYGHYYEHSFSRDESIGGQHSPGDKLDLRVAFSEGWGNAFSSMVRGSALYKDSARPGTTQGFGFDLERNDLDDLTGATGWYAEMSVQEILWDVFDNTPNENNDSVALGFTPIHAVMSGPMKQTAALASIFPFLAALKAANAGAAAGIDALGQASGITMAGIDDWGSTETNTAGRADLLPLYRPLVPGSGSVVAVSTNTVSGQYHLHNGVGAQRFFRLNVPTSGTVTIQLAGPAGADPDWYLSQGSAGLVEFGNCPGVTTAAAGCGGQATEIEVWSKTLPAGEYVLEVLDFNRIDDTVTPAPAAGETALTLTVTQP
jgi:hypothetical protein